MASPDTFVLAEAIEAVNISDDGEALAAMVDFLAGDRIAIEFQVDAGTDGIFGWDSRMIAYYSERGWANQTATVFRRDGRRYLTLNLPRLTGEEV